MTKKNTLLTEGSISKTLTSLTLPMILGMLGMIIFNMVDTFYVGKLGTDQLAALTFTFPVVLIINSLAQGIGVGASSVIAKAVGEGNHHKIQRYTTDSLLLGVGLVFIFVVTGLLTIEPLFRLLGASPEIPTLTGKVKINIPPGTQAGKVLRLRNKGIPNVHGAGIGDQLVQIQVFVPTKLTSDEKSKIKELLNSSNIKPQPDGKKNIFEMFKEALNM